MTYILLLLKNNNTPHITLPHSACLEPEVQNYKLVEGFSLLSSGPVKCDRIILTSCIRSAGTFLAIKYVLLLSPFTIIRAADTCLVIK